MKNIFYSWESDLPNNTNRGFIQGALEKAIKGLNKLSTIELEAAIDRDTLGLPGSPDITESIFRKIDESIAFVCDVSIISGETKKHTPNPNVLIELGYAIKALTWDNIIMVTNTHFGKIEELPFDLRGKRILTYQVAVETDNRSTERNALVRKLTDAIATILSHEKDLNRKYYNQNLETEYIAADRELFRSFLAELPGELIDKLDSSKTMYMDSCKDGKFDTWYISDVAQPLGMFLLKWDNPNHLFIDPELEEINKKLHSLIKDFIKSDNCNEQRNMAPTIIRWYGNFVQKAKIKLAV